MKHIVLIILIILAISQSSYGEPIKSVTINSSGDKATSFRYGNKTKIVMLENGKKVKLLSMGPFYFKNGDPPALVLKYETEIDLSNYDALKSEIDEVWKIFKPNVEKSGFTTAAIRAQRLLKGKDIKTGQGHGFVFLKQADGSWNHMK